MARTAHMAFIGRRRLLEECRQAVDNDLDIWLTGEAGVGKTALAKRITSEALYVPHVSPIKELLTGLLVECCRRGWYAPTTKDGEEMECEESEKAIRKLDVKTATTEVVAALKDKKAVLILDDFDAATATVVRVCRKLGDIATVIACSVNAKPAQQPFLFHFTRINVPRLSESESRELAERLLNEYSIPDKERGRLMRQLIEQAQGMPSILQELVKRSARRGEMSAKGLRKEALSGHKEIDMTPGIVVFCAGFVLLRVFTRGLGDHDLSMMMGGSGVLFMLVRFFAFRLSSKKRR